MLHSELQFLLSAIDAAEADARSVTQGLTDRQANWQPYGGASWSIAQCLDHLAKINAVYIGHFMPPLERASTEGRGAFAGLHSSWFGREFIRYLEPPVRQKLKAPKNAVPLQVIPVDEVLAAYVASHDLYRKMLELSDRVDVNRVVVWNPFIKVLRFRIATVLQVVPAHERRHLWQARRVLAAPGFPG